MMRKYWRQLLLIAALLISGGISAVSDNIDPYYLNIMMMAGMNIILATSLNLVNGHTGQFSLGHAGFMAVGAYASAAVTKIYGAEMQAIFGTSAAGTTVLFVLALAFGGLLAAVCGLIVGVPSLRLKGDYLAIVTLGFGEIIRVVFQNTPKLGGALGISGIPQYATFFWVFGLAAVTIYVIGSLVNSTYGRGFLAVRDDEVAAEAMGINTTKYKVVAFVLGAFFAGLAGGLNAHYLFFISPEGFNFMRSVEVVTMVILGGMGSTIGVAIAAVLLTILNEVLRNFEQYRMIVFALLLILMMILRPQGIVGDFGWLLRKRRPKAL